MVLSVVVVDSDRAVVVMVLSIEKLILSGFVCTDRLTVAKLSCLSCMLCCPNVIALSPVEILPFLMLLGDQCVLLHGKGLIIIIYYPHGVLRTLNHQTKQKAYFFHLDM